MDKTMMFDLKEIEEALIQEKILEVYDALEERGYNPVNQLVGYLISGDPGYISSFKGAREIICKMDRIEILNVILKDFIRYKK